MPDLARAFCAFLLLLLYGNEVTSFVVWCKHARDVHCILMRSDTRIESYFHLIFLALSFMRNRVRAGLDLA